MNDNESKEPPQELPKEIPAFMRHPMFQHIVALVDVYCAAVAAMKDVEPTREEEKVLAKVLEHPALAHNKDLMINIAYLLKFVMPGPDLFTDEWNMGVLTKKGETPEIIALMRMKLADGRYIAMPLRRADAEEMEKNMRKAIDEIFGRIPLITH